MNKKGSTIKDMFMIMIMGVAAMGVIFLFVSDIAVESGGEVPSDLNKSYQEMTAINNNFSAATDNFANLSNSVQEATLGDYAYFGLKGILAIMKTPFTLLTSVKSSIGIMGDIFPYVPDIIVSAIAMIAFIIFLFAAVKFLTSRGVEP